MTATTDVQAGMGIGDLWSSLADILRENMTKMENVRPDELTAVFLAGTALRARLPCKAYRILEHDLPTSVKDQISNSVWHWLVKTCDP